MLPLSSLVLGLGLFFLGLQLVGQNLRQLSGGGFRNLVKSATHTPLLAALLGLMAGALMQSATAVTFVLVSMVGSGLIQTPSARIVVLWCNVGLTALAFLAAFNIHPLVAYLVGGAGIFMGSVRKKPWNTIAGALLGVGLILFALGEMSAGAAPMRDSPWFRAAVDSALGSPLPAFFCGIAAAAILQSNTGAAMLVITLSGAGAIPVEHAMPVIYGTNLGAIILRLFLAMGMTGQGLRLVRMEDLFCLVSGLLMMGLFLIEQAGVPLVGALAARVSAQPSVELAVVFLLSNLLPAILMTPFLPACAALLGRLWPNDPSALPGAPAYLSPQALADPATALDLVPRELSRLVASLGPVEAPRGSGDPEAHVSPEFVSLSAAIEEFCVRLSSENQLSAAQALQIQRFRAWLHTIRHIGEAVGEFAATYASLPGPSQSAASGLREWLRSNLDLAAKATATADPQLVETFHVMSRPHVEAISAIRKAFNAVVLEAPAEARLALSSLGDEFDIAAWMVHRISKLESKALGDGAAGHLEAAAPGVPRASSSNEMSSGG